MAAANEPRSTQKLQLAGAAAMLLILTVLQVGCMHQAQAKEEEPHSIIRRAGSHHSGPAKRRHVTNMVFYMHDIPAPPNATTVVVAAQNGKLTPPSKLGTTHIFDDKLTAGPDPKSVEIGRGQGLYSRASLTSIDLLMVFTAVFHRPAIYNGSTLCLQGSDRALLREREIGVVGGTGRFRFAQGYAIMSTVSFSSNGNATIKFNLTVLLR